MQTLRTITYILWALSIVVVVIGGVTRLTDTAIAGVGPRTFLGLAAMLQLYVMTLLLLELVRGGRR